MKKITILGQEYKIRECTEEEYPKLKSMNALGLCEYNSKEIILDKKALNEPGDDGLEKYHMCKNQTTRHEVIHAFLYESGLTTYGADEVLVEMLSIQVPKMLKVFEKLEIMD